MSTVLQTHYTTNKNRSSKEDDYEKLECRSKKMKWGGHIEGHE